MQPKPYVYMYKCILNTILNHTLNRIRCLQKRFHETKRFNDFNCFIVVRGRPNPVAEVLLHGDHVSTSSLPVRPRKGDHHYA